MSQDTIDGYPATRRMTVEEAESENAGIADDSHWQGLVAQMTEGDELWLSSWGLDEAGLSGAEVLLLVRDSKVIGGLNLKIGVQ